MAVFSPCAPSFSPSPVHHAVSGLSAGCRHNQTRKQPHFIFYIIDSLFFQMCPLVAFWGVTLHQTSLGARMSSVTFIDFLRLTRSNFNNADRTEPDLYFSDTLLIRWPLTDRICKVRLPQRRAQVQLIKRQHGARLNTSNLQQRSKNCTATRFAHMTML